MKLVVNSVKNSIIIDNYNFSLDEFYHNNKLLDVDDKFSYLLHLLSYASNWEDNDEVIETGFNVVIENNKGIFNYNFQSTIPDNFLSFLYEIKKLDKENK